MGSSGAAGAAAAAGAARAARAATAGAHGRTWDGHGHGHGRGGDIPADRIGIQLFTVRDLLADNELDLPGTFEMLADAGYALVEVGGNYDGAHGGRVQGARRPVRAEPEGSHVPGGGDAWRNDRARSSPTRRRSG